MLGLPRGTLAGIGGWRSDFASAGPSELARDVDPRRPVALRGPRIPADARQLSLRMVVNGTQLGLVAYVAAPDGSFVPIRLGAQRGAAPAGPRRAGAGARARRQARRVPARAAAEARGARRRLGRSRGRQRRARPAARGRPAADRLRRLARHRRRRPAHSAAARCASTSRSPTSSTPTCARASRRTACRSPQSSRRSWPRSPAPTASLGRDRQRRAAPVPRRGGRAALPGHPAERDLRLPGRRPARARERAQHLDARHRLRDRALAGHRPVAARGGRGPPAQAAVHGARRLLALAARALAAGRADRPRGAGDAGDRGADGDRARAARARARRGLSERRDEAAELFDLEAQGVAPASLRRQLRLRASLAGLAGAVGGIAHRRRALAARRPLRRADRERDRARAAARSSSPDWPLLALAGARSRRSRRSRSSAPRPGARSAAACPLATEETA